MASDEASLRALEGLMNEFFAPNTTNERKRQIEELLNNFSQQRDAWKHSLYFMSNTHNEYVMMYCMTVLENLINKQWIGLLAEDKMEIRSTLNRFLLAHHETVPNFIRNKLVKLVVDVGRLDWPHFYPDFFSTILQLVQQGSTATLGLILLQTASEELACPREDLSVARKEELHRLLLVQVPTVLNVLNSVLESILEKHQNLVTATPPPSPTHGKSANSPSRTPVSLISSSPIQPSSLLSQMFKSPSCRVPTESLPPLDTASHQLSVLALNCLAHLFSWIPLSTTITPSLLSTIFHFAGFGCEVNTSHGTTSPAAANSSFTSGSGNQSLGVLAMCCINELLSKNCVPIEFEDFLLQMFQQTFYLLQRLTKDSAVGTSGNRLTDIEESYVEKFTEFLRLFVSIHLRRFEGNTQFPMLEFLALLFKYTFKQPSNEGFYNCLDIWSVFIDYLTTKHITRSQDDTLTIDRYKEALIMLVTQILQKIQFRYNQSQLDELDDETLDDDSETEWQHFLRQCLEIIAKVAELMPEETFRLVYQPFGENLCVYLGLEAYITNKPSGMRLNITGENQCRRLHCSLRDLSSLLQAMGRLAEHFIGEKFMEHFTDAQTLMDRLINTCAYATKTRLYAVNSVAGDVLQADFIEVQSQAMATVKANACWLGQFYSESQNHEEQRQKCASMITSIMDIITPLIIQQQVPMKVTHSAAHLLLSVMVTVRASFLLQLGTVQGLYNDVSSGAIENQTLPVQLLVYRSLSHYLLLPWPNLPDNEQQWSMRATSHNNFVKQLTSKFLQLKDMPALAQNKTLQAEVKPIIQKTLQILTDLTETISEHGVSKSKQICCQSLQEAVHCTLAVFPIYIHQPDVTHDILSFFVGLLETLRVQMGVPFIEQILQNFLGLYTREQLAETILHESGAGHRVIEKFLKIFIVIVREPGSSFKSFLPNIISICMEQIYPIIAEQPTPDIKPVFYELLHELLQNNWRYFFKSNILGVMQTQSDDMDNQQQFISIMQAFGQSFLQPDIEVFRQNLEALESLNSRWKLYNKKIFQEMMLMQFLNVLIQVLVHKSHDLLAEEMAITICNMAAVEFDAFYTTFLPQFLNGCEGLDANQKAVLGQNFKMEKDLPSFTQNIHRFVNDMRYYRLCNSSLPEGSVKF